MNFISFIKEVALPVQFTLLLAVVCKYVWFECLYADAIAHSHALPLASEEARRNTTRQCEYLMTTTSRMRRAQQTSFLCSNLCMRTHSPLSFSLSHEVQTNRDKPKTTLQQRRRHPSQPLSIHHYPRIAIRDIQYKLFEPELQRHQHDHLLNGYYKKIITAKKKQNVIITPIGSDQIGVNEWAIRYSSVSLSVRPSASIISKIAEMN